MREITISLSEKEYRRVIGMCNKRNRSPGALCKHILLQLADNDEIEELTGQRIQDSSVYKKQKYNNKCLRTRNGRNNY